MSAEIESVTLTPDDVLQGHKSIKNILYSFLENKTRVRAVRKARKAVYSTVEPEPIQEGKLLNTDALLKSVTPAPDPIDRINQVKEIIKTYLIHVDELDAQNVLENGLFGHFEIKPSSQNAKNLRTYLSKEHKKENEVKPTSRKSHRQQLREELIGDIEGEGEEKQEDPQDIDFDEKDISQDVKDKAEKLANELLEHGKPIEYILETIKELHVGDEATEEAICISEAGQSCLNTAGIQIAVNGESGSGKSDATKKHMQLIPAKWKRSTSLSAKALYYMNLRPGMLIFSDDKDMDPELAEVFKQSTTNYQTTTYRNTVKDQVGKVISIPARLNILLTSVESFVSDQVLNRRLTFETDISFEQKQKIFEMQKSIESRRINPNEVSFRTLVCRRIYGKVKDQLFNVGIPFVDKIDITDKSNSRIFPLLSDMIKGYAVFHYKQRKIDEHGWLLAEMEDFENAKRLFSTRIDNTVTKLTTPERKIVQYIINHQDIEGCNINEISKGTGINYATVRRLIKGDSRVDAGGLITKLKGMSVFDTTTTEYIRDGGEEGNIIGTKGRKAEKYRIDGMNNLELFSNSFVKILE